MYELVKTATEGWATVISVRAVTQDRPYRDLMGYGDFSDGRPRRAAHKGFGGLR
jgi:hypothetical protein